MPPKAEEKQADYTRSSTAAGRLSLVWYTDPLCCYSWAMEAAWQRLLQQYRKQLHLRYCMGGLLPDWNSYYDDINLVRKPIQMGSIWMETRQRTGATINDRIWFENPPASSYPACIAVKAASFQSAQAEAAYLHHLREAVMVRGYNIAQKEVLLQLAQELEKQNSVAFDAALFEAALLSDAAIDAFRKDLEEVHIKNITRFPTLVILPANHRNGKIITGYRPYETLAATIEDML